MKYSLVFAGLLVTVLGTFLVDTVGLTEMCSNEITAKASEWAPILLGSAMAWYGRVRIGDVTVLGVKK